jgi:hypothetical protein
MNAAPIRFGSFQTHAQARIVSNGTATLLTEELNDRQGTLAKNGCKLAPIASFHGSRSYER